MGKAVVLVVIVILVAAKKLFADSRLQALRQLTYAVTAIITGRQSPAELHFDVGQWGRDRITARAILGKGLAGKPWGRS